jgi:uncharacterized membrane protein YagU involved in acid resistance
MNDTTNVVKGGLLPGAIAGFVGGLAFGAAMAHLGMLTDVAALVRADSAVVGFLVHMVIAVIVGAGFGVVVWHQRTGAGETLFWGMTYGALWWFIGPLTLAPFIRGESVNWEVRAAQDAFPSLLGHLLYGVIAGLTIVALRRGQAADVEGAVKRVKYTGPLIRGGLAGLLAAWIVGLLLSAQGQLTGFSAAIGGGSHAAAWLLALLIGVLAGVAFGALNPAPRDSTGAGLVRGTVYGFLWWFAGALTVMPVLTGDGLTWSLADARRMFGILIAYLLFGAATALGYRLLNGLWLLLFSSELVESDDEGAGAQGLRAIGRGAVAGLIGGALFTLVMVQVGFLPTVASIVGADSRFAGLVVHLVISFIIGVAYGLLFRRQSYDIGSALGWGVSYGFFWWVLGPLTLLPLLLGRAPVWTIEAAAGLTASLVGHIAYGAGLGITFHWLEKRYSPWWIPFEHTDAERLARRKEQLLTSAPALWALVVVIALTLPVVVGM